MSIERCYRQIWSAPLQDGGAITIVGERAQEPRLPPHALRLRVAAEAAHRGGSGDQGFLTSRSPSLAPWWPAPWRPGGGASTGLVTNLAGVVGCPALLVEGEGNRTRVRARGEIARRRRHGRARRGCDGEGEEAAAGRGGEGEVRIVLAGRASGWTLTFPMITFLLFTVD